MLLNDAPVAETREHVVAAAPQRVHLRNDTQLLRIVIYRYRRLVLGIVSGSYLFCLPLPIVTHSHLRLVLGIVSVHVL